MRDVAVLIISSKQLAAVALERDGTRRPRPKQRQPGASGLFIGLEKEKQRIKQLGCRSYASRSTSDDRDQMIRPTHPPGLTTR